MWKAQIETPTRLGCASTNTFATNVSLQHKLLIHDLIPFYAVYMESPPGFAAGFCAAVAYFL